MGTNIKTPKSIELQLEKRDAGNEIRSILPKFFSEKTEKKAPLGSKENPFRLPRCINRKLEGNGLYEKKIIKIWGRYVEGVFPKFEGPKVTLKKGIMDYVDQYGTGSGFYSGTMREASKALWEKIKDDPEAQKEYTQEQLEALRQGKAKIPGKVWHHSEEMDGDRPIMQLVDEKEHKENKHTGGSYTWNEKHYIKRYGEAWENAECVETEEELKLNVITFTAQKFSLDNIFRYETMSVEDREKYLDDYFEGIKARMGLSDVTYSYDELSPGLNGCYIPNKNIICINTKMLLSDNPLKVAECILHELRHAYQERVVTSPELFDIDPDTVQAWRNNMVHYINSKYDLQGYREQPLEKDAYQWSKTIIKETINNWKL